MDVQPMIDLLDSGLTGLGFKSISGAADLDAAIDSGAAGFPSIYVMPLAETGGESYLMGDYAQRTTQSFGVVMVVQNLRGKAGSGNLSELATRRAQIKRVLCGANIAGEVIQFSLGRLLAFKSGQMWWVDEFSLDQDYRITAA